MAVNAAAAVAAPAVASGISAGTASLISTGVNLASKIFGGSGASSRRLARRREDSVFQRATADAKLAGLHPLFALGAGGVAGPSTMIGQTSTGSKTGDVLQTAAQGVRDYANTRTDPLSAKLATLQIQNAEINVRKNLIDEQLMSSQLARETQAANATGHDREFIPQLKLMDEQAGEIKEKPTIHRPSQVVRVKLPFGAHIDIDDTINAEDMELAFGEIGGEITGIMKLYNSIVETIDRSSWGRSQKRRIKRLALVVAKSKADKTDKKSMMQKRIQSTQSTRNRIIN